MQKIGSNIQVEKNKDRLRVEVYPVIDSKAKLWFNLWMLAWSFCGLAVVAQLFFYGKEFEKNQVVFLLIYLVFWAYLEVKMLYAYTWNLKGKEVISFENGVFSYTKQMGKRGLPESVNTIEIEGFRYASSTEKGIWNDINRSPWMVGGEVIEYKLGDKVRRLGMKLPKKDAVKLTEVLNKYLTKK